MPWGKLDDSLYDHPKLDALGRLRMPCIGLWAVAISWSNRRLTDGHIPSERIRLLGGTRAQAEALVVAGLFDVETDGYRIHDFTDFNDSRDAVMARRSAAAQRQRQSRESREQSHVMSHSDSARDKQRDEGVSHSTPPGARAPAFPARPDPYPNPDREIPPPPAERGRRAKGTNLRATGASPRELSDNPRANGTSPRQERQQQKRGPSALGDVLRESVGRQAEAAERIDWMDPVEAKP